MLLFLLNAHQVSCVTWDQIWIFEHSCGNTVSTKFLTMYFPLLKCCFVIANGYTSLSKSFFSSLSCSRSWHYSIKRIRINHMLITNIHICPIRIKVWNLSIIYTFGPLKLNLFVTEFIKNNILWLLMILCTHKVIINTSSTFITFSSGVTYSVVITMIIIFFSFTAEYSRSD